MVRRRLRISYDSDDDEEDNNPHNRENGTLDQPPPLNHQPVNTNPTQAIDISDDEFIDVSNNLSPPSPPPPTLDRLPPQAPQAPPRYADGTGSPVGDFLCGKGLRLRREWLESCLHALGSSNRQFSNLDVAAKAKLCYEQFLFSDMNCSGGGILPQNVASMHLVDLPGPFVLQVDEIVNISAPLRSRYQEVPPGLKRCLKLSMTDGVQRVFGEEYRPIKDLKVLSPAGFKVVLNNIHIRHGLLLLVPEVVEVLGGSVEELDKAQTRLINEVNKPPRGRRSRNGVVPALAARATSAAWTVNSDDANNHTTNSAPDVATPIPTVQQGNSLGALRDTGHRPTNQPSVSVSVQHTVSRPSYNVVSHVEDMCINTVNRIGERVVSNLNSNAEPLVRTHMVNSRIDTSGRNFDVSNVANDGESTAARPISNVVSHFTEMHGSNVPVSRMTHVSEPNFSHIEDIEDMNVDAIEHPLILSRAMENPFTYLASLSAKLAAMEDNSPSFQGTIKCILTGVKRFQFKQRETYELLCYVDDGSLIQEILIDHKVVDKGIGHSPREVCAALSSEDPKTVSSMKETMRGFQTFLLNFEGTMAVKIDKTCTFPVAVEMSQGCSSSDAWLLLNRLKS